MADKEVDLSGIEEAGAIRSQILNVHRRGRMNVIHVIGLPGTGKSWACLRLAELLSIDLHGKNEITTRNVVSDLLGLLKFIRSVKKRGEIVICEEMGVWLSSKRAMSTDNVDAGYVWDTLRKKGVIVIGNNPINKDVDRKLLSLSTMMIQTLSLNKQKGACLLKPLRLQTNPDTAKTYRHRLRENGFEVHRCWIGRPSVELTDAYEGLKDDFLDALYHKLEKKHEKRQEKEVEKMSAKVYTPTPLEIKRYKLYKKGLTQPEIAKLEGKHVSVVNRSILSYNAKMELLKNEK